MNCYIKLKNKPFGDAFLLEKWLMPEDTYKESTIRITGELRRWRDRVYVWYTDLLPQAYAGQIHRLSFEETS